ncbi:hypothetical protein T265_11466 [Opisthorchis viverrini]|uniref:Uncharacterized protein n=1 Tax=Opisthorchis viverrini TaxID=6198 RepID=A0A074ZXD9_OPIVI|nr:hypothetical protein T265_11466 [Opisthorchis viverrini]KER19864.1 hypothetical protein T265_11466 [Opisthorchis viverrini]
MVGDANSKQRYAATISVAAFFSVARGKVTTPKRLAHIFGSMSLSERETNAIMHKKASKRNPGELDVDNRQLCRIFRVAIQLFTRDGVSTPNKYNGYTLANLQWNKHTEIRIVCGPAVRRHWKGNTR